MQGKQIGTVIAFLVFAVQAAQAGDAAVQPLNTHFDLGSLSVGDWIRYESDATNPSLGEVARGRRVITVTKKSGTSMEFEITTQLATAKGVKKHRRTVDIDLTRPLNPLSLLLERGESDILVDRSAAGVSSVPALGRTFACEFSTEVITGKKGRKATATVWRSGEVPLAMVKAEVDIDVTARGRDFTIKNVSTIAAFGNANTPDPQAGQELQPLEHKAGRPRQGGGHRG